MTARRGRLDAPLDVEVDVADRLRSLGLDTQLDLGATAVIANVFRTANASRGHLERTVLAAHDLSFSAFAVLWVLWVWGESEFREVAASTGITKGTLTGVLGTVERRGLVERRRHDDDRRRLHVGLTHSGSRLMGRLFREFNAGEARLVSGLDEREQQQLARLLRKVQRSIESGEVTDG
jgi:DNA-binding MarR family transcriptional regulator